MSHLESRGPVRLDRRRPGRGASTTEPPAGIQIEALAGSALLQDLGRDHVASGVPVGGAFDRRAHRLALALVGSPEQQATIEIVGSISIRALSAAVVAVTGTATLDLCRSDRPEVAGARLEPGLVWVDVPAWTALDLAEGDVLRAATDGRAYLAVRGGLHADCVLGSRSTCLLGPLGPAPLTVGQSLETGTWAAEDARAGDFCRHAVPTGPYPVVAGPHASWDRMHVEVLDTSRIGVRLAPLRGAPAPAVRSDLPSLGVLPGTIQALPSGDWMLLGPDAGTMGGYPVVGVLAGDQLDRWAHVQPGAAAELRAVRAGAVGIAPLEQVVRVGEIR